MQRLDRLIWKALDLVILVAVLGMVALITLQVVSRLLGSSVAWTEELSRFLFIWTVWLGLAGSFRAGSHPSLNLLPTLAHPAFDLFNRMLPALCTAVFFVAVGRFGWDLLTQQIAFGETSAALGIGMWWTTLPIVLGSGLGVLGTLTRAIVSHTASQRLEDQLPDAEGTAK